MVGHESRGEAESCYEQWRRKIGGDQKSFHPSLGQSIRVVEEVDKSGKSIVKFKTMLSGLNEDGQSSNSANSMNPNYIRKYDLVEPTYYLKDEENFQAYKAGANHAIRQLPDLAEGEEIEDIMIQFSNGKQFRLLKSYPIQSLFT
mmetsp:Transcript_11379/g.17171  ORF Transcript_11379/g.17171 Transcript_11379/m.17171 type:complete len:145 (+) Transcript_11379:736-1170(+)